jgi:RNA polymerase sigma-70 factor (ECF subfamily)
MRDQLVEHIPALRRFAYGLARDRSKADDLVQDCLARALAREQLFEPSTNLRAWLFTILRNLFLNRIRDERMRPVVSDASLDWSTSQHTAPGAQFDSLLARQVLNAIDTLAVEQREVLLLVAVEGLSYRETADVIAMPIGTVMSRLSRAREQLRLQLEGSSRSQLRRIK